jgi:myo-inositol-1(or 4)-monophosphatase
MNYKWGQEAELSLKAVGAVAKMLEEKNAKRVVLREKESHRDVVTGMDVSIEKHLRTALSQSPHPIIGEEMHPGTVKDRHEGCWYLDPIDGTANYLNNIPFFGTSVGFVSGTIFAAGAVVFPALRELYFVSDCGKAYLNGTLLTPRKDTLENSLIGVAFSGKAASLPKRSAEFELFGALNDKSRGCLRTGSAALNVCFVAAGKMQLAVGFSNKLWDVAGALAIASTAGCRVLCHVEWPLNQISYVVGPPGLVEPVAAEIDDTLNIGLQSMPGEVLA